MNLYIYSAGGEIEGSKALEHKITMKHKAMNDKEFAKVKEQIMSGEEVILVRFPNGELKQVKELK